MSHRVTTQTEIKDKTLAIQALKDAKMAFSDMGDSLSITSGPIAGATVDLKSGVIHGDSDRGHRGGNDGLGVLKRYYAEAKVKQECALQGVTMHNRIVEKDGSIRIRCSGHFA